MLPFFDGPLRRQAHNAQNTLRQTVTIQLQGERQEFYADVPCTATFGAIRDHVATQTGLPRNDLVLIFKGRAKDDSDILLHSGVKQGALIGFKLKPNTAQSQRPSSTYHPYARADASASVRHTGQDQSHPPAHSHRYDPTGQYHTQVSAHQQFPQQTAPHPQTLHTQPRHMKRRSDEEATTGDDQNRGHRSKPPEIKDQEAPKGWTTFAPPDRRVKPTIEPISPSPLNFELAQEQPGIPEVHKQASLQESPQTLASAKAIQKVESEVASLTSQVHKELEPKSAAILKEQLTQRLLLLDSIDVTPETRPMRKALINKIDSTCDELQLLESRQAQ